MYKVSDAILSTTGTLMKHTVFPLMVFTLFGCLGCENKQANIKSENELGDSYSDKLSEKNKAR